MTPDRPPLPPFTLETALQKVRAAENAWNTRDPERVDELVGNHRRLLRSVHPRSCPTRWCNLAVAQPLASTLHCTWQDLKVRPSGSRLAPSRPSFSGSASLSAWRCQLQSAG